MAFSHVCCLEVMPPSACRRWCAHFAEVIISAHLVELTVNGNKSPSLSPEYCKARDQIVRSKGYFTPHIHGDLPDISAPLRKEILEHLETGDLLVYWQPTAAYLYEEDIRDDTCKSGELDTLVSQYRDPSSYLPMTAAWECIMRADHCMRLLVFDGIRTGFHEFVNEIVVCTIAPLAEVGTVLWGDASKFVETWPQIFDAACEKVFDGNAERAELLGGSGRGSMRA